jgi:tRNA threonylcarbamoyladenosine biosynthesis protein TsaB
MLLAVDTSTAQVGLAVCDGNRLSAESIWYSRQHHTVEVAPAIAEILRRCGITMKDIEAIAVAIGPGSFTALRVGLALAKGLALPRKLPMIGVPTLDVLAAGTPESRMRLAAVLQSGRGRIAVGWYRCLPKRRVNKGGAATAGAGSWRSDGEAEVTTVEALVNSIDQPTLVAGELTAEERQRLARKKVNVVLAPPYLCVRRPSVLAEIALVRWQNGHLDDPRSLAPIYLHLNPANGI